MAEKSDFELEKIRHENHLEEIQAKFEAESKLELQSHMHELERQRIKSAEIKKSIDRKQSMRMEGYP